MANVSILSGNVTSADPLQATGGDPGEQMFDIREAFYKLDPDDSQFTTLLMKLNSRPAINKKVYWLEDQYRPVLSALAASAASADTTVTVTTGQGAYFAANDLVRNALTGEAMLVTGVTSDTLGVTRGVGSVAAASSASGAQLIIIQNANKEGASYGTSRIVKRVLGSNYTTIQRDPFSFTGTETAIDEFGGRNPEKEQVKKAVEHKRHIEHVLFFGAKNYDSSNKRGTCGGLIEFISTNVTSSVGTLDKSVFDSNLMTACQHGNLNSKMLFVAPIAAKAISGFLRDNWVRSTPDQTKWGINVDAWVTGAYGNTIPVVVKRSWGNYATSNSYGGYAFLVDMDYVAYRPLQTRDTKLLLARQAPGDDLDSREYLTEFSFECGQEQTHALWKGITG